MHSAGAEKPFSQVEFPKMVRCSDVLLVMIQTLRICGATLFLLFFGFFCFICRVLGTWQSNQALTLDLFADHALIMH